MSGHPGSNKPDFGIVTPPTTEQQTAARAYIARHGFEDETQLLDMLGLDGVN